MGKGQSKQKKIDKFQREHPEGRKAFSKIRKKKRLEKYLKRKFRPEAERLEAKRLRRIKTTTIK